MWPRWRGRHRVRRDDWQRARRRDLGGTRAAAPLHILQGHGVGRVRPCRADGRALRPRGAARPLEAGPRRDPSGGLRARVRRRAPDLHPVLRIQGARRQRPEHPARGLPARRPTSASPPRSTPSRELGRDGFVSRYSTAETDDGLSGDEGQFLACSFWLVSALRATGASTRRGRSSSACRPGQRPRAARRGVRRRGASGRSATSRRRQPPHADRGGARGSHRGDTPRLEIASARGIAQVHSLRSRWRSASAVSPART